VTGSPPDPPFFVLKVHTQLLSLSSTPFGIQKDVLRAKSPFYREELANKNRLELVCKLPHTDVEAFGYLQDFIYTGKVCRMKSIPDFSVLSRVEAREEFNDGSSAKCPT
jgi:hypothetical protein